MALRLCRSGDSLVLFFWKDPRRSSGLRGFLVPRVPPSQRSWLPALTSPHLSMPQFPHLIGDICFTKGCTGVED